MSKLSKACDISPEVRKEVKKRDNNQCIICGSSWGLQVAHFIPRSRLGLGIPQNLGLMCLKCHQSYDQSKYHKLYEKAFREYLKQQYEDWDESNLTYSKWR